MDDKKDIIRPIARNPRGFSDFRGAGLLHRSMVVSKILEAYQKSGFEYLETPAFEYADCLGKFLPDSDRPNEGVFALLDDDDQWMALRYDLTAPLARYVAQNFDTLPKPFRRCAAGPVWRNEKPGPGRFREFWQCDADIIGSPRPEADAEIIATLSNGLAATGIDKSKFVVKVSNRKLLDGLLFEIGVDPSDNFKRLTILRAVDKLDRLGEEGVALLLGAGRKDISGDFTKGAGLDDNAIAKVIAFTQTKKETRQASLDALSNVIGNTETGNEGLEELAKISVTLAALGLDETAAEFDPAIVRGLEYYTGTVFEAEFLGETIDEKGHPVRFGSVGSGGRYDDLVMRFKGERVPATGCSIGVSRLLAALALSESEKQSEAGPVVILSMDNDQIAGYFQMAQELRNAGIAAEVYLGTSGMKTQMKYADRRKARFVIIQGSYERDSNEVKVKDLTIGELSSKIVKSNEEWRNENLGQYTFNRKNLAVEINKLIKFPKPTIKEHSESSEIKTLIKKYVNTVEPDGIDSSISKIKSETSGVIDDFIKSMDIKLTKTAIMKLNKSNKSELGKIVKSFLKKNIESDLVIYKPKQSELNTRYFKLLQSYTKMYDLSKRIPNNLNSIKDIEKFYSNDSISSLRDKTKMIIENANNANNAITQISSIVNRSDEFSKITKKTNDVIKYTTTLMSKLKIDNND